MSDSPFADNPDREEHIRQRAYHLWESEGRPDGRETEYWERAELLIRMEETAGAGLLPNPLTTNEPLPGVTVEEAQVQDNYGEVPGRLTDQGDRRQTPMTRQQERASNEGAVKPVRRSAT